MARLKQYMIFKKLRECGIEELKIKEENIRQICADNEQFGKPEQVSNYV